jgi:hypothetical protein
VLDQLDQWGGIEVEPHRSWSRIEQLAARVEAVVHGSFVGEFRRILWLQDPVAREQCVPNLGAHRHQYGNGPTAVSHFDGFPARNERQVATGMLTQLADADTTRVLHRST